MIYLAINHITTQLNLFLKNRPDVSQDQDIVVNSNLVELDGSVSPQVTDKMVLSLVNVERDTTPHQSMDRNAAAGTRVAKSRPPLYLNLYLVVAGTFSGTKYSESLKWLSMIVNYFHHQPVFDHSTSPSLDSGIERLTMEIQNLGIHDLSNMWGVIGGKYLPSVMYKMRMVVVDDSSMIAQIPVAHQTDTDVRP